GDARLRVSTRPSGRGAPPPRPLHPGDRVTLAGIATPIAGVTNPGAFDARDAWARRDVHARLSVPDAAGVERVVGSDGPLAFVAKARDEAARRLDEALGAPDAGLL